VYHERLHADSVRLRSEAIARIKAELPMADALPLLMRVDPTGDHRSLIALPPQYVAQVCAMGMGMGREVGIGRHEHSRGHAWVYISE
jgi:hypothetical protein